MKNIKAKDVSVLLQENKAILIDVRETFEYNSIHIDGARLMPLSSFKKEDVLFEDGKIVVFYCKKGSRSASVVSKFENENCYSLEGGIDEWISSGFDVVRSGNAVISIDRQVQVIVGILLFVFAILTHFVCEMFVIAIFFIGCGLIFAGLSGFCTLGILLSYAWWNKTSAKSSDCCK